MFLLSQHKIWKQSLSSLQNTQTHKHILTVKKRMLKSSTHSEWRSHFTSPLGRFNYLTLQCSLFFKYIHPLSLLLSHAHTVSMIHIGGSVSPRWAQRAKQRHWYRDSSLYFIYTIYCRPSSYSWHAYRRTEGSGSIIISGGWITSGGFGKCSGSVFVGFWRVQINRSSREKKQNNTGECGSCSHLWSPPGKLKVCYLHRHQLVILHHQSAP